MINSDDASPWKVTLVKLGHEKARYSIFLTDGGMVMEVSASTPLKAWSLMATIPFGIIVEEHPCTNRLVAVWIMALQLLRLSYFVFPAATEIDAEFVNGFVFITVHRPAAADGQRGVLAVLLAERPRGSCSSC